MDAQKPATKLNRLCRLCGFYSTSQLHFSLPLLLVGSDSGACRSCAEATPKTGLVAAEGHPRRSLYRDGTSGNNGCILPQDEAPIHFSRPLLGGNTYTQPGQHALMVSPAFSRARTAVMALVAALVTPYACLFHPSQLSVPLFADS